jgi:anthranilate phosphoribosyltransferase
MAKDCSPRTWPDLLSALVAGHDLDRTAATWAMSQILSGEATDIQIAGFLVALRSKGETVEEIGALAETMIRFATPIEVPKPSVDIVGSGGDRSNTVNISSMAAVVAAAAGARVVKHGNRSASSACGAADLLEELGLRLDTEPEQQQRVIDEVGIGFLFAPHYHPSFRFVAGARRGLGIPTTFNVLGPLTNPGWPNAQAAGIADERMAELVAGVLAARGNQGLVFHGTDGLDELTTTTTSTVWVFGNSTLTRTVLDPRDLGIARSKISDLVGGGPPQNAAIARRVFAGDRGPVRDIVQLNAAAALAAFDGPGSADDLVPTLARWFERAGEAIDSGKAAGLLDRWVAATRSG